MVSFPTLYLIRISPESWKDFLLILIKSWIFSEFLQIFVQKFKILAWYSFVCNCNSLHWFTENHEKDSLRIARGINWELREGFILSNLKDLFKIARKTHWVTQEGFIKHRERDSVRIARKTSLKSPLVNFWWKSRGSLEILAK